MKEKKKKNGISSHHEVPPPPRPPRQKGSLILIDIVREPGFLPCPDLDDLLVELDLSFSVGFGSIDAGAGACCCILRRRLFLFGGGGDRFLAFHQVGEIGGVVGCVRQSGLLRRWRFAKDGSENAAEWVGSVDRARPRGIVDRDGRLADFNQLRSMSVV